MTEEELRVIDLRASRATPGPWAWQHYGEKENAYHIGVACTEDGEQLGGCVESGSYDKDSGDFVDTILWREDIGQLEGVSVRYADAEFIAAAREDVPTLIAEIRRLRAKLA